jgi:hypothetical protein
VKKRYIGLDAVAFPFAFSIEVSQTAGVGFAHREEPRRGHPPSIFHCPLRYGIASHHATASAATPDK